jgi:hypothetical protein
MKTRDSSTAKWTEDCLFGLILFIPLFFALATSDAAQVIYIDMLDFIPEQSQFILNPQEREAKFKEIERNFLGHVWRIVEAKDAIGDKAVDCPGDNDFNTFAELTYELEVKAGEKGPWAVWARLNRLPDPNSWFYRTSPDGKKWEPANFDIGAAGWNNPPGFGQNPEVLQFAKGTLVDAKGPWYWYKGTGNPNLKDGKNFLNISPRESGLPPNNHAIDMVCIRNDGNDPTDEEAAPFASDGKFLKEELAVNARGKLTTTWGRIRAQ